jgi:hypothetical protein
VDKLSYYKIVRTLADLTNLIKEMEMTKEILGVADDDLGARHRMDKQDFWTIILHLTGPGIYRRHALESPDEFRSIGRIFRDDPNRILYIGAGNPLNDRIGVLWKSLNAIYREVDPAPTQTCHRTSVQPTRSVRESGKLPNSSICSHSNGCA